MTDELSYEERTEAIVHNEKEFAQFYFETKKCNMNKKDLLKAQTIIDTLFYDEKALTQWQHRLLEDVIGLASLKLRKLDVGGPASASGPEGEQLGNEGEEKCVCVGFDEGYKRGYQDATSEAIEEIHKNYKPRA